MTTGLRAVMVCVNYSDYLSITLPYNRHHFDSVMVITSREDIATQSLALEQGCRLYVTDAFYNNGAAFNKWLALENGLDVFGRTGWLCLMDADVLWPKEIELKFEEIGQSYATKPEYSKYLRYGYLYSPLRHMMETVLDTIPDESQWGKFPIHRNTAEWAGYTQIFHAESCRDVLGDPPWHQVDWKHAGGADSFFQAKWPTARKVRTPWNVLHLGQAGQNWFGRATPYLDGTLPQNSIQKLADCRAIWSQRDARRRQGLDPYADERIK